MRKSMHTIFKLMSNRSCVFLISLCALFFLQALCANGHAVTASGDFAYNLAEGYRMPVTVQSSANCKYYG